MVSNHSGTLPVDGLMTGLMIHDHTGRHLRPLGADLVFRLPVIGQLARKGGATLACHEDAERMLRGGEDRKSTRLNSSHPSISYAVFCLKKKKSPTITVTS